MDVTNVSEVTATLLKTMDKTLDDCSWPNSGRNKRTSRKEGKKTLIAVKTVFGMFRTRQLIKAVAAKIGFGANRLTVMVLSNRASASVVQCLTNLVRKKVNSIQLSLQRIDLTPKKARNSSTSDTGLTVRRRECYPDNRRTSSTASLARTRTATLLMFTSDSRQVVKNKSNDPSLPTAARFSSKRVRTTIVRTIGPTLSKSVLTSGILLHRPQNTVSSNMTATVGKTK